MKKTGFFVTALLAAWMMISCESKTIDSTKWLDNFEDAKTAAQKEDKQILLFFSADDSDNLSLVLKENLLFKDEFVAAETSKYVLVNLDFSENRFMAAEVGEDATAEEKKAAEKARKQMEKNMDVATQFYVEMSPSFFLATKEGYCITQLVFDESLSSVAGFEEEIESHKDQIDSFMQALEKTKTGTNLEKVQAIEDLFTNIDPRFYNLFSPLARELLKLDPKNESGLAGKYVILLAHADAQNAAINNDPEKMVQVYEKAAENKILSDEDRQTLYYYAGYSLGAFGSTDYAKVREYVQKAYDFAPQSDVAPSIQNMLRIIDERLADTAQMNNDVKIEGIEDSANAADTALPADTPAEKAPAEKVPESER